MTLSKRPRLRTERSRKWYLVTTTGINGISSQKVHEIWAFYTLYIWPSDNGEEEYREIGCATVGGGRDGWLWAVLLSGLGGFSRRR